MSFDCPGDHASFLEFILVNGGFTQDKGQQGGLRLISARVQSDIFLKKQVLVPRWPFIRPDKLMTSS
jgi:hypothetical protein